MQMNTKHTIGNWNNLTTVDKVNVDALMNQAQRFKSDSPWYSMYIVLLSNGSLVNIGNKFNAKQAEFEAISHFGGYGDRTDVKAVYVTQVWSDI
jgi:hypothetical protein